MPAQLIDGKIIAAAVRQEAAAEVAALKEQTGMVPTLAVVLVGENPASQTYVASKGKACIEAGMGSITHRLEATVSQQEVEDLVRALNADPAVNGILVQLPLPQGHGRTSGAGPDQHREGCRRLPPDEHRRAGDEGPHPQVHPVHPRRLHRDAQALGHPDCRARMRWSWAARTSSACRSPRCCRTPTRRSPSATAGRRTCPARCARPTSSWRRSASPSTCKGDWLKPGCAVIDVGINAVPDATKKSGPAPGRRRRLRRGVRGGGLDHAGAGRRGPDDRCHAAEEYRARFQAAARFGVTADVVTNSGSKIIPPRSSGRGRRPPSCCG